MKIVFFGTPSFVLPIVDLIHKEFKGQKAESPIAAVITQPPKPVGKKKILEYSPVDQWAYNKKILKFFDSKEFLDSQIKADVGILAAYGAIIPKSVIDYFPFGILNIHPSLLPKWRGASPVQATLISGTEAGSTIIKIDQKLDHGPIISQFKEDVLAEDTTESLRQRLFQRSAEVLVTLLPAYIQGKITPREQDHSKASFTREIKKEDGFIPPEFIKACLEGKILKQKWEIAFMKVNNLIYSLQPSPENLYNFIRAMNPWPIAWTMVAVSGKQREKKRLKIIKAHLETKNENKSSLASSISYLVLDEVQLEGKNPVSWKQFLEGYPEAKFL